MTVARFWALGDRSEMRITHPNPNRGPGNNSGKGKGGGWTGRGKGGGIGGGGGGGGGAPASINPPEIEVFDLAISSPTLDITTINSVDVSNFSAIIGTLEAMSASGVPTELGFRVSDDGGSTFDAATTYYGNWYISGSEMRVWTADDKLVMHTGLGATGNAALFAIYDLNTLAPLSYESAEMSPVSDGEQKHYEGMHTEGVAIDAIQLIITGGTSPQMTAGTLRLEGLY